MIRLALISTIIITCQPIADDGPCTAHDECDAIGLNACIEGECQDYVPVECESSDDCECDEVCGDTRTCSPLCSSDPDCASVQPWTCAEDYGYCVQPCSADADCPDGQDCSPNGVCWFVPG